MIERRLRALEEAAAEQEEVEATLRDLSERTEAVTMSMSIQDQRELDEYRATLTRNLSVEQWGELLELMRYMRGADG